MCFDDFYFNGVIGFRGVMIDFLVEDLRVINFLFCFSLLDVLDFLKKYKIREVNINKK